MPCSHALRENTSLRRSAALRGTQSVQDVRSHGDRGNEKEVFRLHDVLILTLRCRHYVERQFYIPAAEADGRLLGVRGGGEEGQPFRLAEAGSCRQNQIDG